MIKSGRCKYCGKGIKAESEDICYECMNEYIDKWLKRLYEPLKKDLCEEKGDGKNVE